MERFDFQSWMPGAFEGKPFGAGELEALEEEAGVGRCVVMPEARHKPDNDGLAARIEGRRRMVGCAAVNPLLGEEAVQELERAVLELGFRGLRLFPVEHGFPMDGGAVEPVLDKARELRVPVTLDGCRDNCEPARIASAAARFPEVPFIVDVGFRPSAPPASMKVPLPPEGRIAETAREVPNVYLGLTAMAAVELYCIKRLMGVCGPEKLVFGSNAPWGLPRLAVRGFEMVRLPRHQEEAVLGGTLAALYRLTGGET